MRNYHKSSFLIFFFFSLSSLAQDKLSLVVDSLNPYTTIRYNINKQSLKEGSYEQWSGPYMTINGLYRNGLRNAQWKYFSLDTLYMDGEFEDDKKQGTWNSYHRNGTIASKVIYWEGLRDGKAEAFYEDGIPESVSYYKNDTLQGEQIVYFKNGNLWFKQYFVDGLLNGNVISYYKNLRTREDKNMKNGKRDGDYKLYYEDGKLWRHFIYSMGNVKEVIANNLPDGRPVMEGSFKDGSGKLILFDKDGTIQEEVSYNYYLKDGLARFYSKGKLEKEGNYVRGLKEGLWKEYYEGTVISEYNYVNDLKNGLAVNYSRSGNKISQGEYRNNLKEGVWQLFDNKEILAEETEYHEGVLNGKTGRYEKKKLVLSGYYLNNAKAGIWIEYNRRGKEINRSDYGYPEKVELKKTPLELASSWQETEQFFGQEVMPHFNGGEAMMFKYLLGTIKYPRYAKDNGISGTVYINFIVNATGEIENVSILRGVHKDLDAEAIKCIQNMPSWMPGTQNGLPVSVKFNLPIKFTLK